MDSYNEHIDYDKLYGSLSLAERIDKSTDIVTVLSDTINQGVTGLRIQIDDRANEILDKLDHLDVGVTSLAKEVTLVQGISSIIDKIETTQPDLSTVAKEETLVRGISGIRGDISRIELDMTDLAKEDTLIEGITGLLTKMNNLANQLTQTESDIVSVIPSVQSIQSGLATTTNVTDAKTDIINAIPSVQSIQSGLAKQDTLIQGITSIRADVSELCEELSQGFSGVEERIDQSFTGIISAVQGITGYALNATVAKEQTLVQGISSIEAKIDNIDFTPVEEKLEQIEGELIQGVTAINVGVEEIKELVSGVTGYAQEETLVQGLSGLSDFIDQGFTGVVQKIDSVENELVQGITGIVQEIRDVSNQVNGITGYALDSTVAKEETLVQGVSGIIATINNIPEIVISNVAKQGDNPNVSLSSMDEKLGNVVMATAEEKTAALADLNTQLI